MNSQFLKLNLKDAVNGFVVAFLTAALSGVVQSLDSGVLPNLVQLKASGLIGLTAGLSYLLKNIFTNSNGELLKTEQ